ncbi:hypothetical protein ACS0TY_016748 [Phlomoides rotata]
MEATKERKEQMEKKDDKEAMGNKAREVIREAIISKSDDQKKDNQKPEDVLAYSRTVHHTDSSLD